MKNYTDLVAEFAEKYAVNTPENILGQRNGKHRAELIQFAVSEFCDVMQSPEAKALVQEVARLAQTQMFKSDHQTFEFWWQEFTKEKE